MTSALLPPQNLDAEQSVLGSILLDSRKFADVEEVIGVGDFYREQHRKIFGAFKSLSTREEPIDLITVSDELAKKGDVEKSYLAALASQVPTAVNAVYHAKLVKECAVRRQVQRHAMDILAQVDKADLPDLLSMLSNVQIDDGRDESLTVADVCRDLLARNEGDVRVDRSIMTGCHTIDSVIGGFERGDLVIVGGRPGMGKSAVGGIWAEQIAVDRRAHVFTLEMTASAIVSRLIARHSSLPAKAIRKGQINPANYKRLFTATQRVNDSKLTFDEKVVKLSQIETAYLRVARQGAEMIILDNLHIIDNESNGKNRNHELTGITKTIKRLAKRTETVALALSHLNRGTEDREIKRPTLRDLRESGAIEQDADVVIFLHRPGYYEQQKNPSAPDNVMEFIIAKNREGHGTGIIEMGWDGPRTTYVEKNN